MQVFDELKKILARVAKKREQDITVEMPLFDIEVDIEKLKTFTTVGDLLKHIEERMN